MLLFYVFGTMFLLLFLGVPVAVAIGGSCLVFTPWLVGGIDRVMLLVGQRMITTADSFTLLALPFFILAGTLMSNGGISRKLTDLAEAISGDYPGGLAISAVVACMFFAAVSGSGPATVAAIGAIMIPAMNARGYDKGFSGGLLAAAGGIGVLIPPSIPMIVYGVVSGVSVTDMFIAGVFPGILVGIVLIIVAVTISKKRNYVGEPRDGGFGWVMGKIWDAKYALLMPIIILGGIYSGVFTPTEAGVVAVVYAIILGGVTGGLSLKGLCNAMIEAAVITASCIILMGAAGAFSKFLYMKDLPGMIANMIFSVTTNKFIIMILFNILFLLGGMFIDTLSNILIFVPLLLPIVNQIGIDPIHFGIFVTANLALGMVTPPMGVDLFVAANIVKTPFENILKGAMPFIIANFVAVLIITYVPAISLWPLWIFK
ncbi:MULTISPECIES: TRAP transporter large permease [Aminobacterium]|jgi:C4-dicarboxylate transporter DctM subunit|uniref:TRAP dicarboxylate transporter, DctM subunit n=1 Tax=Aminobacterium colombiense (strain DSM 12261 / ALA-1) TaxID=572547 RepID=D5EHB1_AMICL|nr:MULTISPECIES: TRAP transporter large permease [Aminobacterium]ADE57943.1 TRAP dicarboxylate transporter, DctM subunit [Aminobacterium colombiense DSM 12261]